MSIQVFPGFNAYYYGYYFRGLRDLVPGARLQYTRSGFPPFGHHCLALVVGSSKKRVYVSASDGPGIDRQALAWCDLYAKANLDPGSVPERHGERCFAIGPSFGIRQWRAPAALLLAFANAARMGRGLSRRREHFANYYRQWRYREPLETYTPAPSNPDEIFFAATAWRKEAATNQLRSNFIEACRSIRGLRFEGGLARRSDMPELGHLMFDRRYPLSEYLERLRHSAVAFNTPAVSSCHGWKLAEYLALGKAIVSTPLQRALPAPLRHGEEIHFVSGTVGSIRDAVELLRGDHSYRLALERGARAYYDRYLAPRRVLERVLSRVQA